MMQQKRTLYTSRAFVKRKRIEGK